VGLFVFFKLFCYNVRKTAPLKPNIESPIRRFCFEIMLKRSDHESRNMNQGNMETYLDNAATTRPLDEVCDAVAFTMKNNYGNPSSMHTKGIEAERILSSARVKIAEILDADDKDLLFMSSGSEANNFAIFNACRRHAASDRATHIIVTATEHASVLKPISELKDRGCRVDLISVGRDGLMDLDEMKSRISDKTALIAVSHVNNETGTIQDVREISGIRDRTCPEALLFVDCVQSFCKLDVSIRNWPGVDFISVSSHKIHGPRGAAALFMSKRVKAEPRVFGGGQERGFRSGTENVPAIAGFGIAAQRMWKDRIENHSKMASLKERFLQRLSMAGLKYLVISNNVNSSPYITNIGFEGVQAEVLLRFLAQRGVYVSSGSACSSYKTKKSETLTAMKVADKYARGSIRFSFSIFNTESDIEEAVAALKEIVPGLTKRR